MRRITMVGILGLALLLGSLSVSGAQNGEAPDAPRLDAVSAVMRDGARLPVSRWLPATPPRGIVLALHGFNDFSYSFRALAEELARHGVAVYAYDQRGFGATAQRGSWAGEQTLRQDAQTMARLLRERYPGQPLYVIGESMGAAVAILMLSGDVPVDGGVLLAPAVWGRSTQPWYQRLGLWLGEHLIPGAEFGREWVDIEPTDDPEVMEYWENHPLVIRGTRMQTLVGVTELMDAALDATANLRGPLLVLYGGKDMVVPPEALCAMLERLPAQAQLQWRFVFYPEGWHFLTRDSRAEETLQDITAWLHSPRAALPSGLERTPAGALEAVCEN